MRLKVKSMEGKSDTPLSYPHTYVWYFECGCQLVRNEVDKVVGAHYCSHIEDMSSGELIDLMIEAVRDSENECPGCDVDNGVYCGHHDPGDWE